MLAMLWQVSGAVDTQTVQTDAHEVLTPAVVKNPLPGFVGRMFQWAFNLPQWLQWSAIAIGIIVGITIVVMLIIRRDRIFDWIGTKSRGYKIALAGLAAVLLIGAGGVGYAGNHYTQHNNDFCIGCHVMGTAWDAFQKSEHRKLQCHNCHQQSMIASMSQLYYWVAERPQKIPPHAKVPTRVCSQCHVQSLADSGWKRIIATAGHRLHLKSDSSALKKVECVTCHGQEVHRFKPVDKTCGQSGCHAAKDTKIVLGTMAGQTQQHCTGCHTFTRPVPESISMDSTRKFLIANGSPQSCFGCHDMKSKLKDFDPAKDIGHKGVCGTCHNPHKQTQPKQAFESCASGGCHQDLATKSPFHGPRSPHKVADCGQCHKAHEWKPIGTECIDCHKGIFNSKPRSIPAAPPARSGADPAASDVPSLRPVVRMMPATPIRAGHAVIGQRPEHRRRLARARTAGIEQAHAARRATTTKTPVRLVLAARQVTTPQPRTAAPKPTSAKANAEFSHRIHKVLACAGCHDQKAAPGALSVRTKADCAACHHSPERSVSCEGCHNSREQQTKVYQRPVLMRTSQNSVAKQRNLPFAHRTHRDLECKSCHTNGVQLGVTRDCQSCHTDHHNAERTCITCHAPAQSAHVRSAHDGCAGSGCHTNATVLALPPARSVCLTCHADQVNHKPKRECAECHAVTWGATSGAPH